MTMPAIQYATDFTTSSIYDYDYDCHTTGLTALFTLPFNTPSSLAAQDRLDEEFDTLSAFGCAEFSILYPSRKQRLVTSRPGRPGLRRPPSVAQVLEAAHGGSLLALGSSDSPIRYPHNESACSLPTFPSPRTPKKPQAVAAEYAANSPRSEASDKPIPTPEEILQRARAQKSSEDAALDSFYAKVPALAALRNPRPPAFATGLPTPPPTPPASRAGEHTVRVSLPTLQAEEIVAPAAKAVTPPAGFTNRKREPTAPTSPVSAPRRPSSKIPRVTRKKNKENGLPPAGRKVSAGELTVGDETVGASSKALRAKKKENEASPTPVECKSRYPTYAPTKYGAQPPLGRKRERFTVVGRPVSRIL